MDNKNYWYYYDQLIKNTVNSCSNCNKKCIISYIENNKCFYTCTGGYNIPYTNKCKKYKPEFE